MHRVPTTGGPLVLGHSRDRATTASWCVLPLVWAGAPVPCSAGERPPVACRDRGLAQLGVVVPVAQRAEPPWEVLRRRSCECILPAQPSGPPRRGQRGPASLGGSSGKPGLARAASRRQPP